MIVAPVLLLLVSLSSSSPALEQCRALDAEFDTRAMTKPCQAAADDVALPVPERVDALRRLAFAHILNGDEALAEPVFLRMLVFAPTSTLPLDAGPRFRPVFDAARKRFAVEGRLTATPAPVQTPPEGPMPVQVDVVDRLGRVAGARILAEIRLRGTAPSGQGPAMKVLEDRLTRSELAPGLVRFAGSVPEPPEPAVDPSQGWTVAWRVAFDGWDGAEVDVEPPVVGQHERATSAQDQEGAVALPWVLAGIVGGAAVLGGAAAAVGWCVAAGPCRKQDAWVRIQLVGQPTEAP